jgi:hypothetical protein
VSAGFKVRASESVGRLNSRLDLLLRGVKLSAGFADDESESVGRMI